MAVVSHCISATTYKLLAIPQPGKSVSESTMQRRTLAIRNKLLLANQRAMYVTCLWSGKRHGAV